METQYISLNMTPTGVNPCFHISQYDVGRVLGFIVHSGGVTVDLDTYTCTVEATRSDGTAITSAVATTDNIGTFEVTPTMSNKADKYRCQLVIVDENSKRIASLPFDMEVTKAAMDENSEAIEEDASLYQQYAEAVQGAIAKANADIQAEENARIAAVNAEATTRANADTALQNNINDEATARQTADNTLQGNINSEAATRASADSNLQSQINQIIAPSGEAPSAAEVQNARIGADGRTYGTLGNAIRGQVTDLKSQIKKSTIENAVSVYDILAPWQRGRLDVSDGEIKGAGYRISTTNIQQLEYDATFTVSSGYRVFFCLYDSSGTYLMSTGFITGPYTIQANQRFRMCIALRSGESSSVIADIPTFASNAFVTNLSYAELTKIKDYLSSPQRCGLVKNPGKTVFLSDCTVTGTNVEVLDAKKTRFSKTSKLIRIKKLAGVTNYAVNIILPGAVSTDHWFIMFWMTKASMDTSTGSYFNVRFNGLSNNNQHNNGLSIAENWCALPINWTSAQNITSVQLVFTIRSGVADGDYCGEYWVDSLTFDFKMTPTFILNFDQWWQESIDNGGYDYCFINNIPFTLMTKNYDALSSDFLTLAKTAESLYGCENSYYASYGASNYSLLNASTFAAAETQIDSMKNDFITAFGHGFLSFGCTQMKLNYIDRTALLDGGIKMIRGGGSVLIPYFDADDYWAPSIGISSDTLTLDQVKTQIDQCVKNGWCIIGFTHGVCADDATVMAGSSSNGMHLTDFKAMIDYLVTLRDAGSIQIMTMEDWYNQCTKQNVQYTD